MLNQTNQGSNDLGKYVKGESSRRSWTPKQDDYLLVALKELVVNGWKSDNGFRAGYLVKLSNAINIKFHGANFKPTPHISSKITVWKKLYGPVVTLLSSSGIGFNLHGDYKIECEPEHLASILKEDSNASKIMEKSWPNLDRWIEVFGKDRATGGGAADMMEMVNELIADKDVPATTEEGVVNSNAEDSVCQSQCNDVPAVSANAKKRKVIGKDNIEKLTELLSVMHKDTNALLQTLGDRLGYAADLAKARNEVFTLLQNVAGLSEEEQFDIGDILMEKTACLQMFLTIPEISRASYARRLLKMKK